MKAVILCGGEGTRLGALTEDIPKALVGINGKTLTEYVMVILGKYGVDDVLLSVCYKKDKIKRYFGDKVRYIEEQKPLGTAGFLRLIHFDEDFIVVNGDNIFDVDFNEMIKVHKRNKAVATIALTKVNDVSRYGKVELVGDKIVDFKEKSAKGDGWINGGYYILSPKIFEYLPEKEFIMLEKDIFPNLAKKGKLFGFRSDSYWIDVGTKENLERVRNDIHSMSSSNFE